MDEIRYGVIGTGMMGVEHIQNVNALAGARVVAISDPHADSRDAGVAAAAGTVSVYADHRDLLAAGECDAVVIASPNMTHVDVLGDVLDTDVHVLVEKPLCTTVDDCERVVAQAEGRTGLVWVGLEYRYMPPVAALIREVRAGAVGRPHMIAIREHRFPFLVKVGDWNRFNRNTGGTLVEKCCHFFDLMNLLAESDAVRVYASGGQAVNHLDERYDGETPDILDHAFVVVDYANGIRAMLDLCMFAEATQHQEELSVVGDRGKVEALIPGDVLRRGRRGEHWIGGVETEIVRDDSIAHEGLHHGASFVEHQRFCDAIRHGRPPEVTLRDGLRSVQLGAAAHRSIESGSPVSL
jgi:predicted dehydrogenase